MFIHCPIRGVEARTGEKLGRCWQLAVVKIIAGLVGGSHRAVAQLTSKVVLPLRRIDKNVDTNIVSRRPYLVASDMIVRSYRAHLIGWRRAYAWQP